ncbi:hypothetical protein M0811_00377 [Anaeramoeba ignava]|uniref:Band 7 domain-containing protein n=1 Tax=Anaeramoeba ignava TaxID=1746090 RepID=A0A9Q0LQ93_ANAIG|nr:hypothetical protein M0811_00377 [Anaeramoeba ignava]|eukprot:Anaeramoba_ignava/a479898_124.p1 GENE.a479898_124~~a479898_124.p1  ORF type:complete len:338 (-),score=72.24 a479898_124:30-1043(-)
MVSSGVIAAAVIVPILVIFIIYLLKKSVTVVHEREEVIIERLGKYKSTLVAGVHWILPFVDRRKIFHTEYLVTNPVTGNSELVIKTHSKISTQSEVIDFPSTRVITRDNANVMLDCVLSYKITNTKMMIYSVHNLPLLLSKMLQAFLRNMAATLSIDQIIEDSASLNAVSGFLDDEVVRWGVHIDFVKMQKVDAPRLSDVLGKQKDAQLSNTKIIIDARAQKQTAVIESEGKRDSDIRAQQGKTQEIIARSRGTAAGIVNQANAEARTIKEISRVVLKEGADPIKYLLCLKYIEAMMTIIGSGTTEIYYYPPPISTLQTMKNMGFATVYPPNFPLKK